MFKRYKIADIIADIDCSSKIFENQSKAYEYSDADISCDMQIKVPEDFLQRQMQLNPHLTADELEYMWSGFDFYRKALRFNAFMMHSSAVMYEGYAYLFSANCGTGKSTHASFWQKNFGEDKAVIINDDKPLIVQKNGVFHACGTPWSGKSDKNVNVCVPIAGIAIIERAAENSIEPISPIEAFKELYNQTHRPDNVKAVDLLIGMFNEFLTSTRLFKLHCNMSCEAAQTAYNAMRPQNL